MFSQKYDQIIEVPNNMWFNQVLKAIPSDTIIYKTKPGMGATFSEVIAERDSIIMLPHVSIIKNKHAQYKYKHNTFAIYGDGKEVKPKAILGYLTSPVKFKKFLTTPAGLKKIKSVIATLGEWEDLETNLYDRFFVLIDECQKWIKDTGYREDMIPPMDDFFKFKNKAMVSATVLPFRDSRLKIQKFKHVKLKPVHQRSDFKFFREQSVKCSHYTPEQIRSLKPVHPFKKEIKLLQVNSITNGFIDYISKNPSEHYCIFFNSIKGIKSLITDLNIYDQSTIYCSIESKKLMELDYEINKPIPDDLKFKVADSFRVEDAAAMTKYSFFTSSFYTGLDIKLNFKPNVIIITDVYNAKYSITDPYTDVLQIIGRFRDNMHSDIVHLNDYTKFTKPLSDDLLEKRIYSSMEVYRGIEHLRSLAVDEETKEMYREAIYRVYPFSSFMDINGNYSSFKEDNYRDINRVKTYYSQPFNLFEAYRKTGLYNVTINKQIYEKDKLMYLRSSTGKYSKENVTMAAEALDELQELQGTIICAKYMHVIDQTFPEVVTAYQTLGFKRLKRLKYSIRAIRKAVVLQDLEAKKVRLPVDLVHTSFLPGRSYTRLEIKRKMQNIYDSLGLDVNAKATDIVKFFQVKYCNKSVKGKSNNAFYLLDYVNGMNPAYKRK